MLEDILMVRPILDLENLRYLGRACRNLRSDVNRVRLDLDV